MENQNWQKVCSSLKESLPSPSYFGLVERASLKSWNEDSLSLSFDDQFTKESFEEKCLPELRTCLGTFGNPRISLEVISPKNEEKPEAYSVHVNNPGFLSHQYTLENFVIGKSNEFAHAASVAVARQPGQCYNPLFIFGGAGLGKTHLLRAIGHSLAVKDKHLRIHFLTSEAFTNELIQAIRTDKMREFREKYRVRCDILLLDDVHFFAGKERTQEEFFYTFNYLHESRKQIVITSDRYPKDIEGLENRLQTRFEWGLVADVQPPEIETRIAILKNKAEQENIDLSDDVASYIASHITSNIRELEGSLHRLQAYSSLTGSPISHLLAQKTLKDISTKTKYEITPDAILKLVALHFNLKTIDLRSEKRVRRLSIPRQICMYLLRRHLVMSYPEIGKFMGGKDHTTILHGVSKIAALLSTDPDVLSATTAIEGLIR
jgi:chromosomal replication initiator protein